MQSFQAIYFHRTSILQAGGIYSSLSTLSIRQTLLKQLLPEHLQQVSVTEAFRKSGNFWPPIYQSIINSIPHPEAFSHFISSPGGASWVVIDDSGSSVLECCSHPSRGQLYFSYNQYCYHLFLIACTGQVSWEANCVANGLLVYKTPGYMNCLKDNPEAGNPLFSNLQSRLLRQKENLQWMMPLFSQGYNQEWWALLTSWERIMEITQKHNLPTAQYIVKHINYKFQSKTAALKQLSCFSR